MPNPFPVAEVFGSKARVAVAGTVNGVAFRNSIMPRGDGTHYMNIRKELLAASGASAGAEVTVTMRVDTAERVLELPEELTAALDGNVAAARVFHGLAYSHRKEYADWVGSAKKAETRVDRAGKAVERLLGNALKG